MVVLLFHLLPYPELPESFDDCETFWLRYPRKHCDPRKGQQLYKECLDQLGSAEESAVLDCASGGRISSGFVRGIGVEYFTFGSDPTRSRERFNEAHDLISKAWTELEPFEWISKNYRFRYVNVWPRCFQEPHPPLWVPGFGTLATLLQFGDLPNDRARASMELFAQDVMPALEAAAAVAA